MRSLRNRKNGDKGVEHPKPQIEFLEDSLAVVQGLVDAKQITFDQAMSLLIFNELRCIHYHFDVGVLTFHAEEVKEK